MWLLIQALDPMVAYVIVHILIFFFSFWIHSAFSFQSEFSLKKLYAFGRAVALVKLGDYAIFSVAFVYFDLHALWALVFATALITIARFFLIRGALFGDRSHASKPRS